MQLIVGNVGKKVNPAPFANHVSLLKFSSKLSLISAFLHLFFIFKNENLVKKTPGGAEVEHIQLKRLYEEAHAEVQKRTRFLILVPSDGDVDALSSAAVIDRYLSYLKKQRRKIFCPMNIVPFNPLVKRLPLEKFSTELPKKWSPDCVIVADHGNFRKTGIDPGIFGENCYFIGFDHHARPANDFPTNGVQIVDEVAPSATTVIYDFLKHLGIPITKKIATYTFLGVWADTRGMVGPRGFDAFPIVQECLSEGAPVDEIRASWRPLTLRGIKILAEFYHNVNAEIGFSWVVLKKADHESGKDQEIFESLDTFAALPEIRVAALLLERDDGIWEISLRSNVSYISVHELAEKLGNYDGGGGHSFSAGTRWRGRAILALANLRILIESVIVSQT